jgi:hypothetical protein
MRLVFTESAWEDYLWFQEKDRNLLKRINKADSRHASHALRGNWKARASKGRFGWVLVAPDQLGASSGLRSDRNRHRDHCLSLSLRVILATHIKEGRMVYYSLDDEHIHDLFDHGLEHVSHH